MKKKALSKLSKALNEVEVTSLLFETFLMKKKARRELPKAFK